MNKKKNLKKNTVDIIVSTTTSSEWSLATDFRVGLDV
jgi:hypothetical protein